MKKSAYKSINSTSTKKVVKNHTKGINNSKGIKVIKKEIGQKNGGCKCGCQAMTKSNCPDPFKKPLIKSNS